MVGSDVPKGNRGRSDNLKAGGGKEMHWEQLRGQPLGICDTYLYSMKDLRDPRSHRERYIWAVPMDLGSSSQNH